MIDPTEPRDDADRPDEGADDKHEELVAMHGLMRRMVYADVHHRFSEAVAHAREALTHLEQQADLAHGLERVRAVAQDLSLENGVIGAILIVVRVKPGDEESFGFSRSFAATPAVIDAALPLTHLAHQFEMAGVEPPGLTDVETTITDGEAH